MQKIRQLISVRNQKIKEMQAGFEPSERIKAYQETSLAVIRQDYIKMVQELQAAKKARMESIASEFRKKRPSIREQSEHLAVLKTTFRAATTRQLEKSIETLKAIPPGLLHVEEYHALCAELRDRGLAKQADDMASFTELQSIAMPYVHDPEYRALEKTHEKLQVYIAQSGNMLVLSPDPEKIGKDDIISLENIEGVTA